MPGLLRGDDPAEAALELQPGQQDAAAAGVAGQADVGAEALYLPGSAAAGVRLL